MAFQAAQQGPHAGAGLALQVWQAAHVQQLRAAHDLGHLPPDGTGRRAGVAEHAREDVGIEHTVHGDVIGAGFEAGHRAHGVYQRLAVVRAGAPDQSSVDVEKDERGSVRHQFGVKWLAGARRIVAHALACRGGLQSAVPSL